MIMITPRDECNDIKVWGFLHMAQLYGALNVLEKSGEYIGTCDEIRDYMHDCFQKMSKFEKNIEGQIIYNDNEIEAILGIIIESVDDFNRMFDSNYGRVEG